MLYIEHFLGYNKSTFLLKGEYMNIFKQFVDSLYSAKNMARYRKQSFILTFIFLILLNLIASIPVFFQTKTLISDFQREVIPALQEKTPTFEIKDGQFISEQKEDIVIPTSIVTIKFSSENTSASAPLKTSVPEFEFLKDKMVLKVGTQQTETSYNLTSMNINFTNQELLDFIHVLNTNINTVHAIYMMFFFVTSFLMLVLQIFLISFFGYILMRQEMRLATYKEIWLVSTCAIVIPTIFFTIMDLLQVIIPFGSFIFWGSAIFVLYQIIKEFPKK